MTHIEGNSSNRVFSTATPTTQRSGAIPKSSALMKRAMETERQPQKKEGVTTPEITPEVKEQVLLKSLPNFPTLPNLPTLPATPTEPTNAPQNLEKSQKSSLRRPGVVMLKSAKSNASALALKQSLEPTSETKSSAPVQSKEVEPAVARCTTLFKNMGASKKGESETEKSERFKKGINTPNEILYGYKSVMSSKALFQGLENAFKEAKSPEEKRACIDFATSWIKSEAYPEDFGEVESLLTSLAEQASKSGGIVGEAAGQLKNELSGVKKQEVKVDAQTTPKVPAKSLEDVLAACGNDPAKVAQEFGNLLSEVQSQVPLTSLYLTFNGKESKEGKNIVLSFQNLNEEIITNLINQPKEGLKPKFELYIAVANNAAERGDAVTLAAVASALLSPDVIKPNDEGINAQLEHLQKLVISKDEEALKKIEAIAPNSNPMASFNTTLLQQMGEKNPKIVEFQGNDVFNAKLIGDVGNFLEDRSSRLQNMKERQPLTDFNLTKSSPLPLNVKEATRRLQTQHLKPLKHTDVTFLLTNLIVPQDLTGSGRENDKKAAMDTKEFLNKVVDVPSDVLFKGLFNAFDWAGSVEEMTAYLDFAKSWLESPFASPDNIKKVKGSVEQMIQDGLKAPETAKAEGWAREETDKRALKTGFRTEVKPSDLYFNVSVSAHYLKEKWEDLNSSQKSSKTKK